MSRICITAATGVSYLPTNRLLSTHAHQCRAEAFNHPQRSPGYSVSSVVAVTIPETQSPHYSHGPEGSEIAVHFIQSLTRTSKMAASII